MRLIKKTMMVVLLVLLSVVPIQAGTMPTTYSQPLVELRGAWVSTVSNIDIAQQTSITQYQEQYLAILDTFERFNMNAVFFQVRPTNDAFYESEINPWSRYLIGQQGRDPGWDPLPWLIEETHKRNMEFHAWLNPYRVTLDVFTANYNDLTPTQYQTQLNSALANLDDKNFAKQHPELLIQGGRRVLLNPSQPAARQHIYDTIEEIIVKYDVDAIHFDDYFYTDVHLDADILQYIATLGGAAYDVNQHKDWRRLQVDILIEGIHDLISDFNTVNDDNIQFGISPAAGWAPAISPTCGAPRGMEGGMANFPCSGYSSYHDLYADTRKWVLEEWLDYILPQNYFELGRYHEVISDWWAEVVRPTSVKLYIGLGVYQYSNYSYLTADEVINQVRYNSQYDTVKGFVIFSYRSIAAPSNERMQAGVTNLQTYWTRTPLLPIHLREGIVTDTSAQNIDYVRKNNGIDLTFDTSEDAIGYAIYRFNHGSLPTFNNQTIRKLVSNDASQLTIRDQATNTMLYDYYIQAVLGDGSLSETKVPLTIDTTFINQAPVIDQIEFPSGWIFGVGDALQIRGTISDPDADLLTVTVLYSTDNGVRYRYTYPVIVNDHQFDATFVVPTVLTEVGKIKVEVSDGSLKHEVVSDIFTVVPSDMGFVSRQFYYAVNHINQQITNIIKGD